MRAQHAFVLHAGVFGDLQARAVAGVAAPGDAASGERSSCSRRSETEAAFTGSRPVARSSNRAGRGCRSFMMSSKMHCESYVRLNVSV